MGVAHGFVGAKTLEGEGRLQKMGNGSRQGGWSQQGRVEHAGENNGRVASCKWSPELVEHKERGQFV